MLLNADFQIRHEGISGEQQYYPPPRSIMGWLDLVSSPKPSNPWACRLNVAHSVSKRKCTTTNSFDVQEV
jgi:hypothetical protein